MQHTIEKSVSIEGRGLHTGKPAKLNFFPCEANSGIFFSRIDLPGKPIIPASLAHVKKTNRGTTLGIAESSVHTVEHLLSAIYGLGIDNLRIEIDGEEPPACDGSALPYAETLQKAGRKQLSEPRKICRANQTFWLEEKDKLLAYIPSDKLEITFTIE